MASALRRTGRFGRDAAVLRDWVRAEAILQVRRPRSTGHHTRAHVDGRPPGVDSRAAGEVSTPPDEYGSAPHPERHDNSSVVKILCIAGVAALFSSHVFAQADDSLTTPTGHEVNASIGGYTYTEPGAQSISIHGVKIGGEYTATLPLSTRRHWFAQANVRGTFRDVTYTGWCSPFLITPNSASPNGYELDFGAASPCS